MSKGFGSKLASIPIGKLKTPVGGIFAGRRIPDSKLDDPNWLRVLELGKPPEDGLYTSRESLIPQKKPIKTKGLLYKAAKAMVEYERSAPIPEKALKRTTITSSTGSSPSKTVPHIDDWNTLSPDIESNYLGLEQLEHGESLAIVGAGVTGLTLAWMLSRSRPDVKIDIFETKNEVGGWMCSKIKELPGTNTGSTLFESGPRTLLPSHPGSEILSRILFEIGKRDDLMAGVPQNSATNRKALVCNGEVVQLPASLWETTKFLLSSPLLKQGRWQALKDLWTPARPRNVNDESVRSFISRRLGSPLADRMISAVMRGIYAADADKLSARSVARLNRLYYLEKTEKMSVLGAAFSGSLGYLEQYTREALPTVFDALCPATKTSAEARHLVDKEHPIPKHSLYGFKNGIQSAVKAIADDLKANKNIKLHLNTRIDSITPGSTARTVSLRTSNKNNNNSSNNNTQHEANVAVCTVAPPSIFEQASSKVASEIGEVKYSSLAVVNVWVADPHAAKDWFGILVPKTEDKWNIHKVLGVIFDSSVRNAMKPDPQTHEKGSSMTVMMGGDLWDDTITETSAKQHALDGLKQLKLLSPTTTLEDTVMQVTLQRNAIPLYEVGHSQRQHRVMADLQRTYNGRVALIGMAFGRGCGVSDCVVDALTVALRFSEQRKLLHPEFFFNHWWTTTRPEYYA